mmetsp:Transcript_62514/g.116219  ORF Transcript_62514/g.116219 Transcript_62514/m.116219 type:complete len:223 (-) Transcript_62514:173-841(-)
MTKRCMKENGWRREDMASVYKLGLMGQSTQGSGWMMKLKVEAALSALTVIAMWGSGKPAMPTAMEFSCAHRGSDMLASGTTTTSMVMALKLGQMEQSTKEDTMQARGTAWEECLGQTIHTTKVISMQTAFMVMVPTTGVRIGSTRAIGSGIACRAKVISSGETAATMSVSSRTTSRMGMAAVIGRMEATMLGIGVPTNSMVMVSSLPPKASDGLEHGNMVDV